MAWSLSLAVFVTYVSLLVTRRDGSSRNTRRLNNGPLGNRDTPLTIVIQLKGETGNHLGRMAYGYGLKWILEEDYNVTSTVILRHQENRNKWRNTQKAIRTCFPNFSSKDFEAGNSDEFKGRLQEQHDWLGKEHDFHTRYCVDEDCIHKRLQALVRLLSEGSRAPADATITLPFLYADVFSNMGYINDRYYERLRVLFRYDYGNPNCCSEQPKADETVLHIRGFLKEMPKAGKALGYEELSLDKTVHELLANHSGGGGIAVIGRFSDQTDQYVQVLLDNGMRARRVVTQNGEQSFCFLLRAKKCLIAYVASSFGKWAVYLGNATTARLYSLKSPERIKRMKDPYIRYNYTNPILKERISWELYNSEEQDEIEGQE